MVSANSSAFSGNLGNRSRRRLGRWIALLIIALFVIGFILSLTLHRVEPGQAGVIVDYGAGAPNGQPAIRTVATGQYVLTNPITQKIAAYPIAQQTLTMVRRASEGKVQGDDSVAVQDTNGIPMNIDASILWRVDPSRVGQLYLLRPDIPLMSAGDNDIESQIVRREARNSITRAASEFRYDQIFGKDRAAFNAKVTDILSKELDTSNIVVDKVAIGEVYLSADQQAAITRKATAEQASLEAAFLRQKAENEMAAEVAKAEANQKIATINAKAKGDALRIEAEGQAEAIKIQQAALANAPAYLAYLHEQKWDGKYPSTLVEGNDKTLLTIPAR
jgi:regulator of protease activity HflC (stomatin/prohibitin superfamily)